MRPSVIAAIAATILATTSTARAFCGFYVGGAGAKMFNNATEVVLMRHGTTTVLSMQNNYQGPPEHFALVVPVPVVIKEEQVKTLPRELFEKVDTLGAPRLVEYWEQDPCQVRTYERTVADAPAALMSMEAESSESDDREYKVKVEARFSVGEYNIEVLSAQQSTGLDRWLRDHKYKIPEGAEPLLRPYVEQGTKWFVAKVDPKKVRFVKGMATLSPLRFHYDSPEFTLPIRLGLANSRGKQDLIVNILALGTRYEVANYPNVTIPTNLRVQDAVRGHFGEFYAALFDHALERVPNAVVTEYAWDAMSCDPCPGPTLDNNDLATFGADVISKLYKNADYGFTLTRLHARYGKDVKNDLVFRSVEALNGGTGVPDQRGEMKTDIQLGSMNMFQGRYVILHRWTGSLTCDKPMRGQWGGPPNGHQQLALEPAKNIAFAKRGNVKLSSLVAVDVPSVGILASKPQRLPGAVRQPQGCGGCNAQAGAHLLVAFAALGFVMRRRRRR